MNTTRIDHTGHNHPKTTAARTECRKALKLALKAPSTRTAKVGNGKAIHMLIASINVTRCGIDSNIVSLGRNPMNTLTCRSCINKYGMAHN